MAPASFFYAAAFAATALAQVPGAYTPEVHPTLTSWKCTKAGGCVAQNTSVVLDANYRWLHDVGGYTNCYNNGFDPDFCPDAVSCAANCALEGVDYSSYGIATSGDSLNLKIFKTDPTTNVTSLSSPRAYLLADDTTYEHFQLLNQEISFDVDLSQVPCGINGALYLAEMNAKGDQNALNTAGAEYGTGYCDAQCPVENFIKGEANFNQTYGACCQEMDLWEANSAATQMTPHPCNTTEVTVCEGTACGNGDDRYAGLCDKDGCEINPYRFGNHSYYGYGSNYTIDTSKPFTVTTQFITNDGTSNGTLAEIRRLYVQNGVVIQNVKSNVADLEGYDSITDSYCLAETAAFGGHNDAVRLGGLANMGAAIGRGMVLTFAIWDDSTSYMAWLDEDPYPADADPSAPGVGRGPCSLNSGHQDDLIANWPQAQVTFSNIRSGDLTTTYGSSAVAGKRSIRTHL